MKLAVLFDNFGPYHLARLRAASDVSDLLAVESAPASLEYEWRTERRSEPFERQRMFPEGTRQNRTPQEWRTRLNAILSKFRPAAVAIPGWSGKQAFAALEWCIRHDVPAILMSESNASDAARGSWKEYIKRRYVALCRTGLVGGSSSRDYLVQLGMAPDRIQWGYNAVDNEHFAAGAQAARQNSCTARDAIGIQSSFFLSSARFLAAKNLERLLYAYARYREPVSGGEKWDLVLLGDGPLRSRLLALRSELQLEKVVHLPGFKQYQELPTYYGLASAFVHPSTVEPWGLVVNEAMAAGLPVLVSQRCGCASTLVRDGVNGFGFDPLSIDAMTERLVVITRLPPEERAVMGQAGRDIVRDFGPQQFAQGLCAAAETACAVAAPKVSLIDSWLLRMLLHKTR